MTVIHPAPLKAGDRVALVSPSGPVPDPAVVGQCREVLEKLGYDVWTGPSAHKFTDYLAGWDEERAADLNQAFRDPEIRAPARGLLSRFSFRIAIKPGISCSARIISLRPNGASDRSATRKSRRAARLVVMGVLLG